MPDIAEKKFRLFRENARLLFDRFGIKPLLYGSLGLEVLLGQDLGSDDVDILIPGRLLREDWELFQRFLEEKGYVLTDLHEHTFQKDGTAYAYAVREELKEFAGIQSFAEEDCWLSLTLPDFRKVYEASSKDGYRQNKKNKRDLEKIAIIESAMKESRNKS